MRTAALVTKSGSIDWLCLPAFDSDACFASLIGTPSNGYWTIAPTDPVKEIRRRYRKDTLILETDFITATGTVRLVDFMPLRRGREYSRVCRTLRCLKGAVTIRAELSPRLAFGRAVPRVVSADGATKLFAGPDALFLRGGPSVEPPSLAAEFLLAEGNEISYSLSYGRSYEEPPGAQDVVEAERASLGAA